MTRQARSRPGDATLAIHAGDADRSLGAPVSPPATLASSFHTHPDAVGFSATDLGSDAPHFYTRWSNPTLDRLERRLAALDQGEAAVAFSSGMAAISALFLTRLTAGDHLVISNVCYAGVAELAHHRLARHGIAVTAVDTSDPRAVAAAMRPTTRLVHIETPANPILRLTDVAAVAAIVHDAGAELGRRDDRDAARSKPLTQGADYVVHSLTKYLGGHGDALAAP